MIRPFSRALLIGAAVLFSACSAESAETTPATPTALQGSGFDAPMEAWRTVDPENLILIDTAYGVFGVELFPEIAPLHVERVKTLARSGFYDNVPFHRVIDGFMNQTGDGSKGDGTGDSDLPDLQAEFTFRRGTDMPFTLVSQRTQGQTSIPVGFYKSLPIATQPSSQAMFTKDNKVGAFGLHCSGVTSMARTNDPNSANSQFFLMRGIAEHLDTQYSIWGQTVMGREFLEEIKVGTTGEIPGWVPDQMNTVRVAADVDAAERPTVEVLKVDSPAFANYLKTTKLEDGTFPDICDINVPSRTK